MAAVRWLLHLPEIVLALLTVAMTVVVFMQVLFRYFLQIPLAWSEESARFIFVWVSLIGAVVGIKRREHFGFGLLLAAAPRQVRRVLLVGVDLALLWFAYVLTTEGLNGMQTAMIQRSPVLDISLGWVYAALPVSGALMLLFLVPQLIATIRGRVPADLHVHHVEHVAESSEALAE